MNDTFDRHAFYGEGVGDNGLVAVCGDKRERKNWSWILCIIVK